MGLIFFTLGAVIVVSAKPVLAFMFGKGRTIV